MNALQMFLEHEMQNTHPDDFNIIINKLGAFIRQESRLNDEDLAQELALFFRITDDNGKREAA